MLSFKGAAVLGKERNAVALAILARALLENLILLLWVEVSEANAMEHREAGVAELARAARVNLNSGKARIVNRRTGLDATVEFLASDRFKNLPKRKSVESRAEEAGVQDLYDVFYRFLSLDTHGHEFGYAQAQGAHALAIIHMQGIGAIGKAVGHVGTRWILYHERTDNETLRKLLGLAQGLP